MSTINTDSFEDLAQQSVTSDTKHRMLYVFLRVEAVDPSAQPELADDEEATMVQILFDAHQPAAHGMTFQTIRETADAHNADWNMVAVALAQNSDNSLPTDEQAQAHLADMRQKLMVGAIEGFALLDREGNAIEIEAEVIPLESTATN